MKVYRHIQALTLAPALSKDGRRLLPDDLGIVDDAAIAFDEEKIHWIGPDQDLPTEFSSATSFDLPGHVLTPGLVDCHTHLVFGGDRSQEYTRRLNGEDYQKIASEGGGILYTVKETLKASSEELFQLGRSHLERMAQLGIKTVEIKSGYALSSEGELRLLQVIKKLKDQFKGQVQIISTFMGAHAVPQGSTSSKFINDQVIPTLMKAHEDNLVDAVDIFHEEGYFSTYDVLSLFKAAARIGAPVKMHADEFQDNGGAKIAMSNNALSADHLLRTSDDGIKLLAQSKTVATLLPGTAFFLGKSLAPARKFLDAGCKVAIASDFNPGSSHIDNVLLVASMAAPNLKMNLAELWSAITLNAAHALGLKDQGALVAGMKPIFSLFRTQNAAQITYCWGKNLSVQCP